MDSPMMESVNTMVNAEKASELTDTLMESADATVTIERALELTGYGKFTVLFTLACGICLCGATGDIYSIGFILPAAECDLELDTGSKSLLAGATLTGMILGANVWGFLADRYGRKKIILYSGAGGVCCSLLVFASQAFWPFAIFRFLSGTFITGSLSTIFPYYGECLPQRYRSNFIVLMGVFQNLYAIYIPALAWLLLPLKYSIFIFGYEYRAWRIFLLLSTLPLLLGTLAVSSFPESPKFLLSNGDLNGAIQVLEKIHFGNNKRGYRKYPVKKILKEDSDATKIKNSFFGLLKDQIALILKKKYISNALSTGYLQFGNFAVSSGMLIWYADILNIQKGEANGFTICQAIQNGKNDSSSCDKTFNESMFTQNLWIGLTYMVGQSTVIFALKFCRKTYLQGMFTAVSGFSAAIMMFVTSPILINILFIIFLVLPGLCVVIVNAIVVDLFPTQLRSSAISFSLTMGRLSSLLTTSIVGHLIQFNCHATFFIYAGCLISCAIVAIFMGSKDRLGMISAIQKV